MNSGKIVADGWTGGRDGTSKVLQEVLADLKILPLEIWAMGMSLHLGKNKTEALKKST